MTYRHDAPMLNNKYLITIIIVIIVIITTIITTIIIIIVIIIANVSQQYHQMNVSLIYSNNSRYFPKDGYGSLGNVVEAEELEGFK